MPYSNKNRVNMKLEELIHPEDASTLKTLKSIPALPKIMEKVFQYGYDEISWSENVTTNLRLSESQMPEIYNHLPPICERLGIPVPELYLQMSPIANAWTSGQKKTYIVLTLGLIRRVKGEELDAVLAHECGHILCQHVLYQTLANAVFSFGDAIADSIVGLVGNVAMKPLKHALIAWSRASELSADRVACMFTSAETLARALARINMIPKPIVDTMDIQAWAEQGKDYEALKSGTAWNKIVHWMANSDVDHPYAPVRAHEAIMWEKTDIYNRLRSESVSFEAIEKHDFVQQSSTLLGKGSEVATAGATAIMKKGAELSAKGSAIMDKGLEMTKNVNVGLLISKFKNK